MPKLKTHKGTAKRVWRTGSGKMKHRRANRSHFRGHKTTKQRLKRKNVESVSASNPRVGELIPYK